MVQTHLSCILKSPYLQMMSQMARLYRLVVKIKTISSFDNFSNYNLLLLHANFSRIKQQPSAFCLHFASYLYGVSCYVLHFKFMLNCHDGKIKLESHNLVELVVSNWGKLAIILSYTGDDPTSQSQAADEDSESCIWRKIQFEPTLSICLKVTYNDPYSIFCGIHYPIVLLLL